MKTLALDMGNTRVKAAVFQDSEILKLFTSEKEGFEERLVRYVSEEGVTQVIGASTADHVIEVGGLEHLEWITLNSATPLPIKVDYETPETLGHDRIAGAVGAHFLFAGRNTLVVDAGTCVTYDLVTSEGVFKGGNIAPGLDMRFRAMHEFTARLPLVNRSASTAVLGKSTSAALQLGAQNGILLEIEGYIRRLDMKYGDLAVVLTGGDSAYFAEKLKTEIFVRPNLILVGLNEILRYNVA